MKRSFLLSEPRPGEAAPRPEAPASLTILHFGDPRAERRALEEGAALLDHSDAGRLEVRGGDAAAFLHRLLANDVRGLAPGRENDNLLLSPRGRVVGAFQLARSGPDAFTLELPPGPAEPLRTALDTYLFGEDVELTDASETTAPLVLAGPEAGAVLARLGLAAAPTPGERAELSRAEGTVLVRAVRAPAGWAWALDAGPHGVAALFEAARSAGAVPAGLGARESVRIEAGTPLFGTEIDETVVPQEAGLEHAFSLDKGCYIGQEVVAKVDTYGGLNRRLTGWRLADDTPRARGTAVLDAETGKEVGVITSWTHSPRLATGLALGYVRLRALGRTAAFSVDGVPAEPVTLPLPR